MDRKKPCKECPWANANPHSLKFREYSDKMESLGHAQACHMKTKDVWGMHSPTNKENECAGRKLCGKKR